MPELFSTVASFAPNYWATLALGALCAYLGVFTVLRRIVFTGAALAQAAAAGVAASFWVLTFSLPTVIQAFVTTWGATVGSLGASVGSALALARRERRGRLTADAMVGVVFASSSALAVLFVWRSSVGLVELKNILAGDVLLSSSSELASLWVGVIVVALVHAVARRRFLLVAYDPPFARAQGLDVRNLERVFLASLAVAVAVALRAAGLMLVFGTLVLPPLVGLRVEKTLGRATWVAVSSAWSATLTGFLLSTQHNLPVAPTIVTCEVALLAAAMLVPGVTRIACLAGGALALVFGATLGFLAPERVPARAPEPVQEQVPEQPPTREIATGYNMGGGHSHGGGWESAYRQRALDAYTSLLGDPTLAEHIRARAAQEIGRLGAPEGLRPLLESMVEPSEALVSAAREATGVLSSRTSGVARVQLLEIADGPDPELATHAALVLVDLEHEGCWSRLVERLADSGVPLLLREETHAFLTEANHGEALGYDAFATSEVNSEAIEAWREWAAAR